MEETIIKNKFGFTFPAGMRYGSIIFLLGGVLAILSAFDGSSFISFIIGIVIILFSLVIITCKQGLIIDIKNKKIKEYTMFVYLIERGNWKSIEDFHYVTILSYNISSSTFSRSNREIRSTEKQHQVHLLNERHTKKQAVQSFLDSKKAMEFAKLIASKLDLELTQYNPPTTRRKGGRK